MRVTASVLLTALSLLFGACDAETRSSRAPAAVATASGEPVEKLELSEAEWRERLTPEQFFILRESGTERPFSSPLLKEKRAGIFVCAGCDLPLFDNHTKFESGTGWPSFWDRIDPNHVINKRDLSLGMVRVENVCGRCGGHLGHVFEDGPRPTGLRYCINGDALEFVPADE